MKGKDALVCLSNTSRQVMNTKWIFKPNEGGEELKMHLM